MAAAAGSGIRAGQKITAVAVHEHGTEKFCEVLRFMYTAPEGIHDVLKKWIAVPKSNEPKRRTLFLGKRQEPPNVQALMGTVEQILLSVCSVLTIGQRCTDWFILRQFRATGTNAGLVAVR